MLIEAAHLRRSFGRARAVDDVDFRIESPSVTGLLGANGAGKSTTMRLLVGRLDPETGSARICGYDLAAQRAEAQARLGYLPEAAEGFGGLTVRELLAYVADARRMTGASRRRAMDRVFDRLDLGSVAGRRLQTLSKGWRQRAWLAQALIHDPPVLILDEPTDGLDPAQKERLRALLRELAADKAILMSTHILEEAELLCDRIMVMRDGRIVRDAPIDELMSGSARLAGQVLPLIERESEA